VYVTHDLDEALNISNQIVVLKEGAVQFQGSSAEIAEIIRQQRIILHSDEN
jgi:ABC-type proline/glycine betaine transport system ATPase subunit